MHFKRGTRLSKLTRGSTQGVVFRCFVFVGVYSVCRQSFNTTSLLFRMVDFQRGTWRLMGSHK